MKCQNCKKVLSFRGADEGETFRRRAPLHVVFCARTSDFLVAIARPFCVPHIHCHFVCRATVFCRLPWTWQSRPSFQRETHTSNVPRGADNRQRGFLRHREGTYSNRKGTKIPSQKKVRSTKIPSSRDRDLAESGTALVSPTMLLFTRPPTLLGANSVPHVSWLLCDARKRSVRSVDNTASSK